MYRVKTRITFTQLKSYRDVNGIMQARSGTLLFNFCHEFNVKTSWNTLTDDGEITLPKNIYIRDKNGVKTNLGSTNINIGGFVASPYFLRGDKVKIESGYIYYDRSGNELAPMKNKQKTVCVKGAG
jgi:hypothetical protein